MTLPRGIPPTPSAASSPMEPVGMTWTFTASCGAQPHDGALAELPLDLRDGSLQGLELLLVVLSHGDTFLVGSGVDGTARRPHLQGKSPTDSRQAWGSPSGVNR